MNGIFNLPGTIRPSQLISTFGPGSIYDNLKDSFLILGIDYWERKNLKKINDPTLLSYLRNDSTYYNKLKAFMVPVSSGDADRQIPVKTFPSWGVCPDCGMLQKRDGKVRGGLQCISQNCTAKAKKNNTKPPSTRPVRFIVACQDGHVDDFPWYEWAHKGKPVNCRGDGNLYLIENPTTSSLESLVVECRNCNSRNAMGSALTTEGLKWIGKHRCKGKRPWLENDVDSCTQDLRGMLKGASNVYFSSTIRSVTVPPFSDELSQDITEIWDLMAKITDPKRLRENIKDWLPQYDPEAVMEKFRRHKEARTRTDKPDIIGDEFKELNSGHPVNDADFKTEPLKDIQNYYKEDLDKLVLVRKLREMIVLKGFTRINPSGTPDTGLASISNDIPEWLPAVENHGEGIFLSINEKKLSKWEGKSDVQERFKQIVRNKHDAFVDEVLGGKSGVILSARYIFLHTLSHLIIREMSNFAGYSTSSIRERIYGRDEMAGILIYTSSSSSDGSLGGLVEQGKKNFGFIMQKTIRQSQLCSSDPLCALLTPGTGNRRNGSACHACLFLPETSCECMNDLLDRSFIHSTIDLEIGFFGMDKA